MATSIINSLFGVDPAAYQQAQQRQAYTQDYQAVQLDPLQQANLALRQSGRGLAQVGGGLLGMQDPMLAKASMAQQLSSQFDTTTSDGLRQYAQALVQSGAPDLAQIAVQRADEIDVSKATVYQKMKEAQPKTEEIVNQGVYQAFLKEANGDPILAAQLYKADEDAKKLKRSAASASKSTVDLSGLSDLFAKKEAEASAKDVTDQISKAQEQLKTNSKLSRDIAELEKIIPNSFTGQLSDIAKTSSKTLSALGVPVSEKASNTEVANALFNNFVLPAVKQLPGSLAAKELAFLQQTKPNSLQEPATIRRLVKMVKEDISANRALVKRADEYQKQDKLGSLKGFNIALQSDDIYTNLNKYNALKAKVQNKQPITKDEAEFAKAVEKELGL
jgi:hypothetical protein